MTCTTACLNIWEYDLTLGTGGFNAEGTNGFSLREMESVGLDSEVCKTGCA